MYIFFDIAIAENTLAGTHEGGFPVLPELIRSTRNGSAGTEVNERDSEL
jgi:hypothetical protein